MKKNVGKKKREQGPRGGKTGLAKAEGRTGEERSVGGWDGNAHTHKPSEKLV